MKHQKYSMPLILAILLSSSLQAQDNEKTLSEDEKKRVKTAIETFGAQLHKKANFTPFGSGNLANYSSNFNLSSNFNKGENAKMELNYERGKVVTGLSLDQALDKDATEATLFDLSGPTTGTKVGFSFQFGTEPKMREDNLASLGISDIEIFQNLSKNDYTVDLINSVYNYAKTNTDILSAKVSQFFFRAEGSFIKSDHIFVTDSITLTENSDSKLAPMASLVLAKSFGKLKRSSYGSLRYSYSVSYENSDKLTLVVPFGSTSSYVSREVVFGQPSKKIDHIIKAEYRTNFNIVSEDRDLQIGFAPSLSLGLSSDLLSLSLPVYMLREKEDGLQVSGLQGGFRVGYITGTKEGDVASISDGFIAQLIVAVPFNVFTKEYKNNKKQTRAKTE
jgi:hypothetical protein